MPNDDFPSLDLSVRVDIELGPLFAKHLAAAVAALLQPPTKADVEAIRNLLRDLDDIRAGRGPSHDVLGSAPLLTDWTLLTAPDGLRMIGRVVEHSRLGDRARIVTSRLYAIDGKAHGWARTLTRYYHLAPPHAAAAPKPRGERLH